MSGNPPGTPSVSPEEAEYFRSIEERFCALRGAALLLSPRDWNLIAGWWAERIPLPLVLESLEEVFAARRRRGDEPGSINSLAYTRPEVLRRFRLHREMATPRRGEGEERERLRRDLGRHFGRVARHLKASSSLARERGLEGLARAALEAAGEIRRLRGESEPGNWDPLETEKALEKLDGEILQAAWTSLEEEGRKRLERQAEELLRSRRAAMQPDAYRESLTAVQERLLRRELDLPRLSLLAAD